MSKKVGALIKKARTDAGLTQEQLARKVKGASKDDIGKAERGEKDLTQAQLKEIAKATGVTQASLLNAAKGSTGKTSGKTAGKTSGSSSFTLTAEEKKLIKSYRAADEKVQSAVKMILGGSGLLPTSGSSSSAGSSAASGDMLGSLLESAMDLFGKKK